MKSPEDHLRQFMLASARASWAPVLVFGLHVIFSRVLGAYLVFPHLDIPMHFFGGMAIIYFFTYVFAAAAAFGFLGSPNRMVLLLLSFLAACSSAVFWEFAELLSDCYLGTHALLGLNDTLSDMLLGIVGALVCLAVSGFRLPIVTGTATRTPPEGQSGNASQRIQPTPPKAAAGG